MQKVALIVFDKFEEIEAVCPADLLKRAGFEVSILTLSPILSTIGRSGISICADAFLSDQKDENFDAVVLPGGPGTTAASHSPDLLKFLKRHNNDGKIIAAICAAPIILKKIGILDGRDFTAHTSVLSQFVHPPMNLDVVVSGNIITSKGAGTAIPFGLEIISLFKGESAKKDIAQSICYPIKHNA